MSSCHTTYTSFPFTATTGACEFPVLFVSLWNTHVFPPSVDFFMNISLLPYVSSDQTTYRAEGINVAVMVLSEVMVTSQVFPDTLSHPVHPVNVEPVSSVAVSVTDVPELYASEQSALQLMPAGKLVTVPEPVPVFSTVRVYWDIPFPLKGISNCSVSGSSDGMLSVPAFAPADVG